MKFEHDRACARRAGPKGARQWFGFVITPDGCIVTNSMSSMARAKIHITSGMDHGGGGTRLMGGMIPIPIWPYPHGSTELVPIGLGEYPPCKVGQCDRHRNPYDSDKRHGRRGQCNGPFVPQCGRSIDRR